MSNEFRAHRFVSKEERQELFTGMWQLITESACLEPCRSDDAEEHVYQFLLERVKTKNIQWR